MNKVQALKKILTEYVRTTNEYMDHLDDSFLEDFGDGFEEHLNLPDLGDDIDLSDLSEQIVGDISDQISKNFAKFRKQAILDIKTTLKNNAKKYLNEM